MPLRRALAAVEPYRPQPPMEVLRERLGLDRIVKLASNEGAFGPLPAAVEAFNRSAIGLARYPAAGAQPLREALAGHYGLPPAQVVVGNGADELIRLCAVATLDAGDAAAFMWPGFPSYGVSAACSEAGALRVPLRDRGPDLDAVLAAVGEPAPAGGRVRLVYLANPNNPTGTVVAPGDLERFLDALPPDVLCVLDEAYAEYADTEPEGPAVVRSGRPGVCVLRTFSKAYGLAALRVGYALAAPDIADALDRVRPIFNVNEPAQAAALASLGEEAAVAERVAHARAARAFLYDALAAAGLDPIASQANFVYADVPGGDADGLAERLLREGYIVRALRGFGAPGAIRITCGTDPENAGVADALRRVAGRHGPG